MDYKTILSVETLQENLENPTWAILDCRFYLQEPERGYQEYLESHIPGAIYIHLDRDLSGEILPGVTGRHPLPDSKTFAERLSGWGIDNSTQVIAYDNKGGALAARLWWMLRWLGHDKAAVLNGDWRAWSNHGFSLESGEISRERKEFQAVEHPEYIATAGMVERIREDENYILLDARSPERYWGLEEPIDDKAGHIPGAVTAPYENNLTPEGYFLSADKLKERFESLLEGVPPSQVVVYCGSGVTSNHNLIAMVMAGYEMGLLYSGSWSEWITDPSRPVSP
ncbi:MAG TPA: sulfurtransferase [Chloroflexi bacterium]|nr:MAG: sulfurtransferase [Chloroflexota bacterium]HDN04526.1 sulfurtransferase [Chloroflexota bacterium]